MQNKMNTMTTLTLLFAGILGVTSCAQEQSRSEEGAGQEEVASPGAASLDTLSVAYVASGCFWCVEAIFESVEGVREAVSGYAGGLEENPSYEQVSRGATGHTEAVRVYYDSTVIDYPTLLRVYYGSHDPTTVDGQAPDFGRQYRSALYATNDVELALAKAYRDSLEASGAFEKPIATEIALLKTFWEAEEYHQNFERRNPEHPYIRNVSIPRLKRFMKAFPELLKKRAGEE